MNNEKKELEKRLRELDRIPKQKIKSKTPGIRTKTPR